jgi:hypothetical protein
MMFIAAKAATPRQRSSIRPSRRSLSADLPESKG